MPKAQQLTVSCENRPGTLAQIAKVLGDAKVTILAFVTTTSGAEGSAHLVVDNANKAKEGLDGAALSYSEADVLHIELPNLPGALGVLPENWPRRRSTSPPATRPWRKARRRQPWCSRSLIWTRRLGSGRYSEDWRLLPSGGSVNMNAKDLDRYRQLLLAKRREIEAGAIGTIGAAGGLGERQADVIDQATDAAQVDLQVRLHQTASHLLRAIDEALARIDRQAFGVCETCKLPISAARLEAVPWTRFCRDCKEQQRS